MLIDKEIKELIEKQNLITNYVDLDIQLQPTGFDLTIGKMFEFKGAGTIDFTNEHRQLPQYIDFTADWCLLKSGGYLIETNETLNMPKTLTALMLPRSTLLRCGASFQTAVIDSGFSGKLRALLTVYNGIIFKKNARIAQIVFFEHNEPDRYYSGIYGR